MHSHKSLGWDEYSTDFGACCLGCDIARVRKFISSCLGRIMQADATLDVTGLNCPLPLLKAKQALRDMLPGQVLCIMATDPASQRDFSAFAQLSAHTLLNATAEEGIYTFWLQKGI